MKKSLNLDLLKFHVCEATQELDLLLDLIQYTKDETRREGNLAIAIAKMKAPKWHPPVPKLTCYDMSKLFVDYVIRDYTKPMGVATYKTADEMPENLRKALPPVEELRRLLDGEAGNDIKAE